MFQLFEDCEAQLAKYKEREQVLQKRELALAEKAKIPNPVVKENTVILKEDLSDADV